MKEFIISDSKKYKSIDNNPITRKLRLIETKILWEEELCINVLLLQCYNSLGEELIELRKTIVLKSSNQSKINREGQYIGLTDDNIEEYENATPEFTALENFDVSDCSTLIESLMKSFNFFIYLRDGNMIFD